jgi:DNA-binding NarL/FixJ family response regulator
MPSHSHEELLVLRGWKSLNRATDLQQSIWLLRLLDRNGPRRLTSGEFALASKVARGCAVKQAAADLDLAWDAARTTMHRALRKLGLRSCAQLPAFWHGLSRVVSASRTEDGTELLLFESRLDGHALWAPLTSAERHVLQAVLMGHDTQEIARQRSTSVRTVANQLSILFRKFGVSSRGELAARALLLDDGAHLRSLRG